MRTQPDSPFPLLVVGFFIGAVTVGGAALIWNHDSPSRSKPPLRNSYTDVPPAATPLMLDPAIVRVASRFVCSCGTCGEKRLDICSCETAAQERAFIQEQLRNGRSEAEAAEALNQKYGGLKS